jgi:hypothetical protein
MASTAGSSGKFAATTPSNFKSLIVVRQCVPQHFEYIAKFQAAAIPLIASRDIVSHFEWQSWARNRSTSSPEQGRG